MYEAWYLLGVCTKRGYLMCVEVTTRRGLRATNFNRFENACNENNGYDPRVRPTGTTHGYDPCIPLVEG